ncbi:hypothetical protein [Flavobacterium sp.]|uniref:hypothetical protein n=1 Tax=Flavobacterium sp. TaxID=239 RepID=UPI003753810B
MLNGIKNNYYSIIQETDKEIRILQLEILLEDLTAYIMTIDVKRERNEAFMFLNTITSTMM